MMRERVMKVRKEEQEPKFRIYYSYFCMQNFQEWWKVIKNREEGRVQKCLISICCCVLRIFTNVGLVIFDVTRSSSPFR